MCVHVCILNSVSLSLYVCLKNTRLNAENCSLKKNISALFRTAKQEVARKDAEIQRLNQRYVLASKIWPGDSL